MISWTEDWSSNLHINHCENLKCQMYSSLNLINEYLHLVGICESKINFNFNSNVEFSISNFENFQIIAFSLRFRMVENTSKNKLIKMICLFSSFCSHGICLYFCMWYWDFIFPTTYSPSINNASLQQYKKMQSVI
jgi:hypothetical protein